MAGMEGGPPPGEDDKPTVTIVHKIKCKLGYAELHKPAPGYGPGEEVSKTVHPFVSFFTITGLTA